MTESRTNRFWSKIKNQYGSASAALSSLSLTNSEHDGDTENDTVIHNALYKFYQQRDGRIPAWLGVEVVSNGIDQSQGQPQPQMLKSRSQSSSLQDMYRRRQQAQQHTAPAPNGPAPNGPARTHSHNNDMNGMSSLGASGPDRSDKYRNKLRSAGRANW